MAKELYVGIDDTAREVTDIYVGVNGISRKVKKAYIGVNGVAREWYSSGKKLSEYGVGDIVLLPENGTNVEYIVVHQGLPSSVYDTSCNGTWLLRKKIYVEKEWHTSRVNDYKNSTIHSYLNNTFYKLFDTTVQSVIKQVRIPYRAGSGASTTITSGTKGLSTKVFLLSASEIGFDYSGMPTPYGELDYFLGCKDATPDSKRKAYLGSKIGYWWTRSPCCSGSSNEYSVAVGDTGDRVHLYCDAVTGVRPALVMNGDTVVDSSTNVIL